MPIAVVEILNAAFEYTFLEGPAPDTVLAPSDKFRVDTYLAVIDSLNTGLPYRLAAYEEIQLVRFLC